MKTLDYLINSVDSVPLNISWYLADLGEAKGKQDLFKNQAPQQLQRLLEHAIIESSVSSNRIEGVTTDQKRIGTVLFGKSLLKDRNEEEIRGYRDVLDAIHSQSARIEISESTIQTFHARMRGDIWDAGQYKEKDSNIIEKYPDGRERIRFRTVSAQDTPNYMTELVEKWHDYLKESRVPPLLLLCAFNLDFLCIHPFRDGNGRVSRLLLLLGCYHLGLEVGRFISLERLIEENKERYYETLEISSQHWHNGKHDPWPYIGYLLFILKSAYKEFQTRVETSKPQNGTKTGMVHKAVESFIDSFTTADIMEQCPAVSIDLIRKVLRELSRKGKIQSSGRGRDTLWKKTL